MELSRVRTTFAMNQTGGDCLLEITLARTPEGEFCWLARGPGVAEFCVKHGIHETGVEGWPMACGFFQTERAAERDLEAFTQEFIQDRYPGVPVDVAPPRGQMN